jgi:hypothetical protein
MGQSEKVPAFKHYYASPQMMDAKQKGFYDYWCAQWECGKSVDVGGNISYLFCFAYALLAKAPSDEAISELIRLADAYINEPEVYELCRRWASDCYTVRQEYPKAVEVFPVLQINARASYATNSLLSLKLKAGVDVEPRDILTLCGPKVTKFGKENLTEVENYIRIILDVEKKRLLQGLILEGWIPRTNVSDYVVYNASLALKLLPSQILALYEFSNNKSAMQNVQNLTRQAENAVRQEAGLPNVGEGWIAETQLYYEIKDALSQYEVIQHCSPDWIGRQHLDIYIPEKSVAIEYQGKQHDEPIAYFGGEEAYKKQQNRDKRKAKLCRENSTRLIYVRPGYSIVDVVDDILTTG